MVQRLESAWTVEEVTAAHGSRRGLLRTGVIATQLKAQRSCFPISARKARCLHAPKPVNQFTAAISCSMLGTARRNARAARLSNSDDRDQLRAKRPQDASVGERNAQADDRKGAIRCGNSDVPGFGCRDLPLTSCRRGHRSAPTGSVRRSARECPICSSRPAVRWSRH